jgi:1-acyl-sn-glycerol-3-phosphate acyltransferase
MSEGQESPTQVSLETWIRSWIYLVAFVTWSFFCCVLFLPLLVARPSTLVACRAWASGILVLARIIVRIDSTTEGREHLPQGACIVAAQHQASYETFRMFLELERPVFVLKRELTWIPMIGWYMYRAGMVPIDRGRGVTAMRKMLRAADTALARGDQIVIFPEGTRTPHGVRVPYRPGVAAIYSHCKVPLIPMALNSGRVWGKTRVLKLPGTITFKFLPALPDGLQKDAMLTELRARLEGAGLPE